jgi:uncharacterized protein (TIGR02246 family)
MKFRNSCSSYIVAIITVVGLAAISGPQASALVETSRTNNPGVITNEQMIRNQAKDFEKAFAAGDATVISAMWTSDGSLIDESGQRMQGRSQIQKYYEQFFTTSGPQKIAVEIRSINFPSDSLAVEEGMTKLGNKSFSYYSALHLKQNGKWQMANVVEFPGSNSPTYPSGNLKDLSWLAGNWTATRKDSNTKEHFQVRPLGKAFLSCRFFSDKDELDSLEIIGMNQAGQIISWTYNADGGYAIGRWINRGNNWSILSKSYEAGGKIGRALYLLNKAGADKFSWKSQSRMIDQMRLADSAAIEVIRDQSK